MMRSMAIAGIMMNGAANAFADFSFDGTTVIPTLHEYKFREWLREQKVFYPTREEYRFRFENFKKEFEVVEKLNHEYGSDDMKFGMSPFSDMTESEFEAMFPPLPVKNETEVSVPQPADDTLQLPDRIDWWKERAVTPSRKYPRECRSSSYALAAADMMESFNKIQGNELVKMSAK